MKVNKQENTGSQRQLYVGIGEVKVLKFNPTRAELDELLGITRDENAEVKPEFEYVKENVELIQKDKDGNETGSITTTQLNVTAWVKEEKTQQIFPVNFTLYRTEDMSSTGKYKFVNQHGKSIYCDSEENLSEYFTNTPGKIKQPLTYKKAYRGEASLLEFLACWTNINPFDCTSSLFVEDNKRFWNGDMKELNSLLIDFANNTVMCNFYIKTREIANEDGGVETKEYTRISTKGFCSGNFMNHFRQYAKNNFAHLHSKAKVGSQSMYALNKFIEDIYGDYGVKDFTVKSELTEYQQGMNPVNSDQAVVTDEDAAY